MLLPSPQTPPFLGGRGSALVTESPGELMGVSGTCRLEGSLWGLGSPTAFDMVREPSETRQNWGSCWEIE